MDEIDKTDVRTPSAIAPRRESRFTPGAMLADRFRIIALLGKGGMAEVYRAEDVKLGQQVALKFLPERVASDSAKLERLLDEVRIGRQVAHPNVVRLYDIVEWEGHHFISMEYIDGEDLASLLRRIGKLPYDKAVAVARDICLGLAAAHALGIIHRDLKPANIMLDGRGTARVTDFGLAALTDDLSHRGEIAGTPVYMAPEQLSGGEVTERADLYALGLVLYEMFTGKRRFEAASVSEILAQHESSSRSQTLSQDTKDIDPAMQSVILRCLEERPASRPASIHSVIAALPGGDPLQAALDAGETPSPEMVAAAGASGELRPSLAWALLIAAVLLLLINAAVSQRTMLYGRVALPKRPDVLVERARNILTSAGHTQPPSDVAYNFGWNNDYFDQAANQRKKDLERVRPSPVVFYYRESPRELMALDEERRVSPIDPPFTVAGMANVELDPAGRLIQFAVLPPEAATAPATGGPVSSWSALLAETGIDATTLRAVAPLWRAPVDNDHKLAWEARYPEQPDVTVRVEAASYRGKPVWLSIIPPWQQVNRTIAASAPATSGLARAIGAVLTSIAVLSAYFLARRNLRRSRGDRKGALRLGVFLLFLMFYTRVFRADHVWSVGAEIDMLVGLMAIALFTALVAGIFYLAIEPYFRRRWPRMLIGWSRMLAGRLRDPMVGRDVLIGAVAGSACAIIAKLPILFTSLPPIRTFFTALTELRHLAFLVGTNLQRAIWFSLFAACIFLLFRIITRSTTAATVLLVVTMTMLSGLNNMGASEIGAEMIVATLIVAVFVRYGLLALAVAAAFQSIVGSAPLTLDPSVWYLGRSFFVMAMMATLAGYGFWVSLAAQPLFGLPMLEED